MPFVVTSCAFKIHRASGHGRGQPRRTNNIRMRTANLWVGPRNSVRDRPVSRSRTQSFQENRPFSFQVRGSRWHR